MATLAEIRQKYPQYSDMSDGELARGLHAKFYSDMPFGEFASKIGLTTRDSLKQSNPAEYDPASPEYQAKYGATSGMTWGDKFSAGVGKSFVDTARGVGQLFGVESIPFIGANDQQAIDDAATRDKALMETGAGLTGNIAGQVAQFAAPGGYVARAAKLPARLARGAAFGAGIANTQPVTSEQTRLGNTAWGAAGGAAGEAGAALIGRAAKGASDKVVPEVRKLAERARELGIPLRVEQVTGSRPMAGISAALDTVPFSGRDASRGAQRSAWNRALSRTIGQNDTNLTTAVRNAEDALGSQYDDVLKNNVVRVDEQFTQALDDALKSAKSELPEAQFGVISRQVDEILGKLRTGDVIDGQAAYNIKRVLDRIGRSKEPYSYHARLLKDALIQALDRSLPQDVASSFVKTRAQYANLIPLRKALRAGAEGTVTPAKLATLDVRGDLKELADIGATFLVEPFGNSGTANRTIGAGLIGALGGGAFFDPTLAMQAALGGATVGRSVNTMLSAQPVVNYAMRGSGLLGRLEPQASALLPALGAISSQ